MFRVLIVDDDAELRSLLVDTFREEGFSVSQEEDGEGAVARFTNGGFDAVLLDLKMPSKDGMEAMREILMIDGEAQIVILTAHGDIETAVQAVKEGAYDFVAKPPDYDKLVITLKRAAEKRILQRKVSKTRQTLNLSLEERFGKSPVMRKVIGEIEQLAETDCTVIIQGETGTGKSYAAHTIHSLSGRSSEPFVRVDIGLIPDQLVESELFGYTRGAFTGARQKKTGYFKEADGGTLFIDDMENMSSYLQQKLLTVVDEKRIYPLGNTSPVSLDVRLLTATNRDVKQSVESGEFRDDLYYRLGEFVITLPPLRERKKEIPNLAQNFLLEVCAEMQKPLPEIDGQAISLLKKHPWPGNLRELKNVMRRAVLLSPGNTIDKELASSLLANQIRTSSGRRPVSSLKGAVKELEARMIKDAIEETDGNKSKASELLSISYPTLLSKIKEYDIK